jgi:uncharacterized protein (TIGR02118 family)
MVKLTFCVRRLSHLSFEEFDYYWRENHAKLVHTHAETLKIRRYVQAPVINKPSLQEKLRSSRGAESPNFDGVAELWWDSFEDIAEALKSPDGKEADRLLLEDEKRFIDLSRSQLWYSTEREIISP